MPEVIISGRTALFDEADLCLVQGEAWTVSSHGYAIRVLCERGRYLGVRILHREIVGAPDGMVVDHINGNKLDNRRSNLRVCTNAENLRNRKIHKNNSCGLKGVYLAAESQSDTPWRATIRVDGVKYHLGYHATKEIAKQAYDRAAKLLNGEFANAG